MSADNIKVAIKARPLLKKEKDNKQSIAWKIKENSIQVAESQSEPFYFDHIFDQNATNQEIFEVVARPIVSAALRGFNGTIFAYGQTSSGKTYAMLGDENNPGVIHSTAKEIFKEIEMASDRFFLLRVGYIEIYNEKIYDLLDKKNQDLKIYETGPGEVTINCTEFIITSQSEMMEHLQAGNKYRKIAETNMNERSSRSHAIFRIIIESREADKSGEEGAVQISNLNLVDLAGSERADQTGATGSRLIEGGHINRSLLSLSCVIKKLSENESDKFINYRDSKLTRILQASLGGNALTAIICTIKPSAIEETNSTLSFAMRAKTIKNKPQVNEVLSDAAMLKKLAKEIARLECELEVEKRKNSRMKVHELEKQIKEQELKIVHSHSKCMKRKDRRRTWCPSSTIQPISEKAESVDSSNSATDSTDNVPLRIYRPPLLTPLITMRTTTLEEELPPAFELIDFDNNNASFDELEGTPKASVKFTSKMDPNTPKLDWSQKYKILEQELEELKAFTNLEKKVNVEHEVVRALNDKLEEAQSEKIVYERERFHLLTIKEELETKAAHLESKAAQLEMSENRCAELEAYIAELEKKGKMAKEKEVKYLQDLSELTKKIKNLEIVQNDAVSIEYEYIQHKERAKTRENDLLSLLEEKDSYIKNLESKIAYGLSEHSEQPINRNNKILSIASYDEQSVQCLSTIFETDTSGELQNSSLDNSVSKNPQSSHSFNGHVLDHSANGDNLNMEQNKATAKSSDDINLSEKNAALLNYIEDLKKENEHLQIEYNDMSNKVIDYVYEIESYQNSCDKLQLEITKLKEIISNNEDDIEKFKQIEEKYLNSICNLETIVRSNCLRNSDRDFRADSLERDIIVEFTDSIDEEVECSRSCDNAKGVDICDRLKNVELEINRWKDEYSALQDRNKLMNENCLQQNTKLANYAQLEYQNNILNEEIRTLKQLLQNAQQVDKKTSFTQTDSAPYLDGLSETILLDNSYKNKYSNNVDYDDELQEGQTFVQNKYEEINKLEKKILEHNCRIKELELRNSELMVENENSKKFHSEELEKCQHSKEMLQDLQEKLDDKLLHIQTLEERNAEFESFIRQIQRDLFERSGEVLVLSKQINCFKTSNSYIENSIESDQNNDSQLNSVSIKDLVNVENLKLKNFVSDLGLSIKQNHDEINSLIKEKNNLEVYNNELEKQLTDREIILTELKERLKKCNCSHQSSIVEVRNCDNSVLEGKISELEKFLNEKNSEIDRLNSKIDELISKESLITDNNAEISKIPVLESELDESRLKCEEFQTEIDDLRESLNELGHCIQLKNDEIDQLRNEIVHKQGFYESNSAKLKDEIEILSQRCDKLETEEDNLKSLNNDFKQQITRFTEEINKKNNKIDSLKNEIESQTLEISNLSKFELNIAELKSEIQKENNDLCKKITILENDIIKKNIEIDTVKAELEKSRCLITLGNEATSEISSLKEIIAELKESIQKENDVNQKQKNEINNFEKIIKQKNAEIEATIMEDGIVEENAAVADESAYRSDVEIVNSVLTKKEPNLLNVDLTKQFSMFVSVIETNKMQIINSMQNRIDEIFTCENQITKLEEKLKGLIEKNTKLYEENENNSILKNQQNIRMERMREILLQTETVVEKIEQENSNLQKIILKLEKEIAVKSLANIENDNVKDKMYELKDQVYKKNDEIKCLQIKLEENDTKLTAEIENFKTKLYESEEQIRNFEMKLYKSKEKISNFEVEKRTLQNEIEQLSVKKNDLEKTIADKSNEIECLKVALEKKDDQLKASENTNQELLHEQATQNLLMEQKNEEIENVLKEIKTSNDYVKEQKIKIQNLQEEIENFKADYIKLENENKQYLVDKIDQNAYNEKLKYDLFQLKSQIDQKNTEMENIDIKLKEKDEQIRNLEVKYVNLQNENKNNSSEREKENNLIEKLKEKLSELEREIEEKVRNYNSVKLELEENKNAFEEKLHTIEQEKQSLLLCLETKTVEITKLQTKIQSQIDELKKFEEDSDAQAAKILALNEKLECFKSDHIKMSKTIEEVLQNLENVKAEKFDVEKLASKNYNLLKETEANFEAFKTTLDALENNVLKFETEKNLIDSEKTVLGKKVEMLSEEIEFLRIENQKKCKIMEEENSNLLNELTRLEKRYSELEGKHCKDVDELTLKKQLAEEKLNNISVKLLEMEEEQNKLMYKITEMEKQKNSDLDKQREQYSLEKTELEQCLQSKEDQLTALKAKHSQAIDRLSILTTSSKNIEEQLHKEKEASQKLHTDYELFNIKSIKLKTFNQQIVNCLKSIRERLTEDNVNLVEENSSLAKDIGMSDLCEEIGNLVKERNDTIKQLHELQKMHVYKCKQLQNETTELKIANEKMDELVQRKETEIGTLREQCSCLKTELRRERSPRQKQRLSGEFTICNEVCKEHKECKKQQELIKNLMGENNQLKVKNQHLATELEDLRKYSQTDRKTKRQSMHDEKRHSLWDSNRDIGTMTDPTDKNCACEELNNKVLELNRTIRIKDCQIRTLMMESKNNPFMVKYNELKQLLVDEDAEKTKLRLEILHLKKDVQKKKEEIQIIMLKKNKAYTNTSCQTDLDKMEFGAQRMISSNEGGYTVEEYEKLHRKCDDLKKICRLRNFRIKELEGKSTLEKENECHNEQISRQTVSKQIESYENAIEALKKDYNVLLKKYEDCKFLNNHRKERIEKLEAQLKPY